MKNLKERAIEVRDERGEGMNTAERLGSLMLDMIAYTESLEKKIQELELKIKKQLD